MNPTRRVALPLLLVFVLTAALLPAQKHMPVSDDALTDMVRRKLTNDPDVKGGSLDVQVKDAVVTLGGSVEMEKQKQKAEKLTRKVRGVKQVVNNITVRQGK